MNWILKNKNKTRKTILFVLFLVFILFNFKSNVSFAADPPVTTGRGNVANPNALAPVGSMGGTTAGITNPAVPGRAVNNSYGEGTNPTQGKKGVTNSCKGGTINCIFIDSFKFILIGILNVVGWLFSIAATLFTWVVNPANISEPGTGVLQKQAVKDVWIMVRDLLNMMFILVLLFAAFCTIFQVDKWNLKKVWLNVLINALLVNFSYPIARFFIDISNVAFYYFINNLFSSASGSVSSGGIFAMFGAASGIGNILMPENYANYDIAYLVTMIIILFIMGMTLLIIAALFVVRLVALTMLVMFSPIGFVGYIFPSMNSYADKWWTNLFSYSFFAPIMIFGMAIALKVTEAIGKENMQAFKAAASQQAPTDQTSFIAEAAFMVIPIVILWTTIGVAKSMGVEGADKVVSNVKKGGKWIANRPNYAWNKTGIPGGVKGYEKATKTGELFGSKKLGWALKNGQPDREEKWAGAFGGGKKGWDKAKTNLKETANKESIEKGTKAHIDNGMTAEALARVINSGHATTKDDMLKHAQAGAAYQRMDNDERKAHITASMGVGTAAGNYGDFDHMFTGSAHPTLAAPQALAFATQQAAAKASADAIKGGTATKADHQTVAAFINRQMKEKVAQGVKA